MIGHSLFGAAAALSLVALLVVAPASAMDKQVTQGGPDLTKARALIKAKDFAAAIKELKRLEPGIYIRADDDPRYYFFTGGGTVLKDIRRGSAYKLPTVEALLANGGRPPA